MGRLCLRRRRHPQRTEVDGLIVVGCQLSVIGKEGAVAENTDAVKVPPKYSAREDGGNNLSSPQDLTDNRQPIVDKQ